MKLIARSFGVSFSVALTIALASCRSQTPPTSPTPDSTKRDTTAVDSSKMTRDTLSGHWVQEQMPRLAFINGAPLGMYWVNNATGYLCGELGVVGKTTDSGATWMDLHENVMGKGYLWDLNAIAFWDSQIGVAVGGGYQGKAQGMGGAMTDRTTDGGNTWKNAHVTNALVMRDVKIFVDARARALPATAIAVGLDSTGHGIIVLSDDAGATWTTVKTTPQELCAVATSSTAGSAIVVGAGGQIFTTADYGATWSDRSTGSDSLKSVSMDRSDLGTSNAVIAGNSTILWSSDGGHNWTTYSIGLGQDPRVYLARGSEAWMTASGIVTRTTNSGAMWRVITPTGQYQGAPTLIGGCDPHRIPVAGMNSFSWFVR